MRFIILIALCSLSLSASLLDFSYLNDAKKAYENKAYDKAEKLYEKVDGDEAKFNHADALYRQKKYKEALDAYSSISNKALAFKKQYNMGNSYAQLGKTDEAIKAYENALKLKDDKDAKFNLELLKKKKQQKKDKKKNKKDKKQKKNNKNKKDKKQQNKDQQKKKNQKKNDQQNKQNQSKENNQSKEQNRTKPQEEKKKKAQKAKQEAAKKKQEQEKKKKKQAAQMAEQNQTKAPISNMEERKWQKMLNKRGVNTLMLPLNKGEQNNETNPW